MVGRAVRGAQARHPGGGDRRKARLQTSGGSRGVEGKAALTRTPGLAPPAARGGGEATAAFFEFSIEFSNRCWSGAGTPLRPPAACRNYTCNYGRLRRSRRVTACANSVDFWTGSRPAFACFGQDWRAISLSAPEFCKFGNRGRRRAL